MEGSPHLWGEDVIPAAYDEEAAVGLTCLVDYIKRRHRVRRTGELVVPGHDGSYVDLPPGLDLRPEASPASTAGVGLTQEAQRPILAS